MDVTFEDYYDEKAITPEQANQLDEYAKVYTDKGIIKKREHYKKNVITHISHYISSDESESEIINLYSDDVVPFSVIEILTLPNHKIQIEKTYVEYNLKHKSRWLYNTAGYVICDEQYNISTDQPMYDDTEKFFYDISFDDCFPLMTASYNEDGSLEIMSYKSFGAEQDELWFYEDGTPGINDIPTLAKFLNLTMNDMEYYLTAKLEP